MRAMSRVFVYALTSVVSLASDQAPHSVLGKGPGLSAWSYIWSMRAALVKKR